MLKPTLYLATKGIHPHDHRERDGWVARLAGLKQISSEYFELKDRSMDARYLRAKLPPGVQEPLYTNQFSDYLGGTAGAIPGRVRA